MSDRVEKFVAEFEHAIDAQARQGQNQAALELAGVAAQRLERALDQLAAAGITPAAVSIDDLQALRAELTPSTDQADLRPLIDNAKALLVVVEDGIVDGDAARLRAALGRATAVSQGVTRPSTTGPRSPRLELDDVVAQLPDGPFTVRALADRIDRPVATTRNYLDRLVERGLAQVTGEDASGRGRPTKIYERA